MELAGLAAEAEADGRSRDPRVRAFERGQAERAIAAGVFLVAHPDEGLLQQLHDGGHDFAHRQHGFGEIARHATAKQRQRCREAGQPVVLRFVAHLAPSRVIAILLASFGVASRGLEMAGRAGTDPDVSPGRRNGE